MSPLRLSRGAARLYVFMLGAALVGACGTDSAPAPPEGPGPGDLAYRAALEAAVAVSTGDTARLVHPGMIRSAERGVPLPWHRPEFYLPAGDAIRRAVKGLDGFRICGEMGRPACQPGADQSTILLAPIRWDAPNRATVWLTRVDMEGHSATTYQVEVVGSGGRWSATDFEPICHEN